MKRARKYFDAHPLIAMLAAWFVLFTLGLAMIPADPPEAVGHVVTGKVT